VLARPEWSEERLERRPDEIAPELARAFAALCAKSRVEMPEPTHELAHRWRFALASREGGLGSALDARLGLGVAGDWMRGTRVEDAYLSGVSLAGRVLGMSTMRARSGAGLAPDQAERSPTLSTTRG
jgi:renalase